MSMLRKKALALVVGAMVLGMSAGCSRNPTGTDPNAMPSTDPGTYQPTNPNSGGGSTPIFNPGGGGAPVTPVQVNATVTNKTMSGFWIFKKIKSVTVQVQNPSSQNVTGKVTVTFSKKGQQVETQDQPFSLAGGQSTTLTVTPAQKADDAVATAMVDQPAGGGGFGGTGGFGGSTPGFGGTPSYGGSPSYGGTPSGTGYGTPGTSPSPGW